MTNATAKIEILSFASKDEAIAWMFECLHEEEEGCIDNVRFAFEDDSLEAMEYDDKRSNGCCGYFDSHVIVDGRAALVGCNYGH